MRETDSARKVQRPRTTSLWHCLHDGHLLSVMSDRLERMVVMNVDVPHLRERLGAAEEMTFHLRFDGVQSVGAAGSVVWPGPPPVIAAGMPHAEQHRLVDEYQAKWREESIDWDFFEASLTPAGERLGVAVARLDRNEKSLTLCLQGNHSRDDRLHEVCIRATRISVGRSDGVPFGLDEFIALGEAYWRDFKEP
jgi:hypothetical protein